MLMPLLQVMGIMVETGLTEALCLVVKVSLKE